MYDWDLSLKFCRLPWISVVLYKYGDIFVAAGTFTVVTMVHPGYLHIPRDFKNTASNNSNS